MGKILMINVPYAGHTNPTLPLARELVRRGHMVTYINSEEYRTKIEETGAEFIPYMDFSESPTSIQKKKKCFRAAYDTALNLNGKYDLLIYEMFFYPGFIIAKKLEIPCIRQFSQSAWNKANINNAPFLFRIAAKLIDSQVMGKKNQQYMGLQNTGLIKSILENRPELNIVYVPSMFQRNRESFDVTYSFTAPVYTSTQKSINIPYEKMKSPIIYISLGSIINSKMFYKKCIHAFQNTEFSVILNTGRILPVSLGRLPENIYAYSFVPQIEVLQHVDIFLTHCGMNSINEAIAAKVPMIAMPIVNDQIVNGKRIAELGIGKQMHFIGSGAHRIYQTAKEVYHNKNIKLEYEKIDKNTQEDSFFEIVDQVEKLLPRRNVN